MSARGPQISYAKLNDDTWGIRVAAHLQPSVGDEVIVRKANGETKRERLGSVVSRDQGAFPAPATYYRIMRQPRDWQQTRDERLAAQTRRERDSLIDSVCEQAIKAAEEVADYTPASYEYFDGETEIQEAHEQRLLAGQQGVLQMLRDLYRTARLTDAQREKVVATGKLVARVTLGCNARDGFHTDMRQAS
jgi:hypothetical protein